MENLKLIWVITGSCLDCFYNTVLYSPEEKRNYYKKRNNRTACKGCPKLYYSDEEYNNEKQCYKQYLQKNK